MALGAPRAIFIEGSEGITDRRGDHLIGDGELVDLSPGSPRWSASGAGLGALQGEKLIDGGRALLDGLLDRP